jgi:hypothetical protein
MKCYFVSHEDALWLNRRAEQSAISGPIRNGYMRLFNKNAGETVYVKVVAQSFTRHGWIVELDEVPTYFKNILHEEPCQKWS